MQDTQNAQKRLIAILSVVLIMLTTFAYSALVTNLAITSEATIRALADIRVTNIEYDSSQSNGGTLSYEPTYTKNTITSGFTLPSTSAQMSYTVTITNNGEIDQAIYNLTNQSNNSGLIVLVNGQPINESLPIIVPYKTSQTITVTYKTTIPGEINVVSTFDFRKVYYIDYVTRSDSTIAKTIKYENVNTTITNQIPTKAGYTFSGWTDEQNGEIVKFNPNDSYTLNEDKTLYALYTRNTYTITFDADNGETNPTKEIAAGDSIGELPTVTKDGYHFDGWFTAETDGTEVTTSTIPTGDDTYYAHYTPYTMTINYYANGAEKNGNTTLSNQLLVTNTYNYDETDLATNGLKNYNDGTWHLTKTGYTATGKWHVGSASANTKIDQNTKYAKIQDLAEAMGKLNDFKTGNITVNIYAGWVANTYQLRFNKNDNGATGTMSNQTFTYDQALTAISTNVFTKIGYTFTGWNTESNGTGTPYSDKQKVKNLTTTNNEIIDLYAQWIATTYTISYDDQNGTTVTREVAYDSNYTLPTNPTKEGYTFGGWFTDTTYTTQITSSTVNQTASDQTLVAKWTANAYAVTFNPNGGTVNPTSKSVTYDQTYGTLPTPSKTGYTFDGWSKEDLFDDETILMAIPGATNINGHYTFSFTKAHATYGGNKKIPITNFKENKQYTLTIYGYVDSFSTSTNRLLFNIRYTNGDFNYVFVNNTEEDKTTFTTPIGKTISEIGISYGNGGLTFAHISRIELVEGNESYITSSSIVKTPSNHTLYAQYSANELTFNDQTPSAEFNTSTNSINITGATNGTGNYKYSKVSENNGTSDTTYFTVSGTTITSAANTPAGTYTVVVKATDNNSGMTKEATYTITINRKKIAVPTCTTKTYNTVQQTLISNGTGYTVTNNTGTTAGDYTVNVTPTSNYQWNDDTTTTKELTCTINPYDITDASVVPISGYTYDGTAKEPVPSVVVNIPSSTNTTTLTSNDYDVSYANNTNAGTASLTITGKGNYTGTVSPAPSFIINKAQGYLTFDDETENVEYSTASYEFNILTHSGNLSVSDNNATATTTLTGNKVTIGNISTLPVGTEITVTVTSAATSNYTQTTKDFVLRITNKPLVGGTVKITGNNIIGNTLTATITENTTPVEADYTYTWYKVDSNNVETKISGPNSTNTYTVASTDAGSTIKVVVTATKTNYEGTTFEDTTDVANNKTILVKEGVTKPTNAICNTLTYTGSAQTLATIPTADELKYGLLNNSGTNAGNYTVTARLNDGYIWSNGDTSDVTLTCSIAKSNTTTTLATISNTYNGTNQAAPAATTKLSSNNSNIVSPTITYAYYSGTSCSGTALSAAPKDAGTYRVMATLTGTSNYNTSNSGCVTYTMNKKDVAVTWTNVGPFTYNGSNQGPTATGSTGVTGETITLNSSKASTVGTHTSTATCASATSSCDNYNLTNTTKQFTINAQKVNPITNLKVGTDGKVTWTNSSNATGYQISINSGTYKTATNGGNYLSDIVASTGTITIKVKAINSDTTNYTTSDEVSTTVSVVKLTINSNNTNYGTVNNTSYNVISGVTYSSSSNVLTLLDGRTSTATKIDLTGYTTNFSSWSKTSGTITANTTITANFTRTANSYIVTAIANGGSIASTTGWTGTGNTSTKSVIYDAAYGTLPTVSRDGYTLKGWSLLPEGYKQVEYIESTGTQYINTGAQIFNNTNHEIVIDFEPTSFYNYNSIWGSTANADSHEGWIYSTGALASRYMLVRYGNDNTIEVNNRYKLDLIKNGNNLYKNVNNQNYGYNSGVSTSNGNETLLLFLSGSDYGKYKMYGSQIYSEGELIRNFIPCVQESTGKAGLYDLVNGVFYGNSATSGNDFTVPEEEYFVDSTSIVNIPSNHNIYAKWEDVTPPTKPVITAIYSDNSGTYTSDTWTNKQVSTIATTTDEGSGVKLIQYSVDNGTSWSTFGGGTVVKDGNSYRSAEGWSLRDGRIATSIYKATDNSKNTSVNSEPFIVKYDTSGPTITASDITYGSNLSIKLEDAYSGVVGWQVTNSSTAPTTGWTSITNTASTTVTKSGLTSGTWYVWSIDEVGNTNSKQISVGKASISVPTCTTTYDKTSQTLLSSTTTYTVANSPLKGTNAGTYTVNVTPTSNYQWNSGSNTTSAREVTCTINPKQLDQSKFTTGNISKVYDGNTTSNITLTANADSGLISGDTVNVTYASATYNNANVANASSIAVTGITLSNSNYTVASTDQSYLGNITRKPVTFPTCSAVTYNKQEQTLFAAHSGDYSNSVLKGTNAGNYTVALTPNANSQWSSGSNVTSARNLTCTINKYNLSNATIVPVGDITYDTEVHKPTPAVIVPLPSSTNTYTLGDNEISYTYSPVNPTDVGEYTITATATADSGSFVNNYTGSISESFNIVKANGYVNLSANSGNSIYGTATHTFTVTSSHGGTLSVTDNRTTPNTSISGNTVTVSGLGSLSSGSTVTVTVTSAATNNYKAATATYVITIADAALTNGSVTITGNNVYGETLTANITDTSPAADSYTCKWYKNSSDSTSGGTLLTTTTASNKKCTYTLNSDNVEPGKYIYVVVEASKANYTGTSFNDKVDATNNKTATVKTKVTKPTNTICTNPTYNGSSQAIAAIPSSDSLKYSLSGHNQINYSANDYTVTATLATNYIWSDYTTSNATFKCNITRRNVTYKADSDSKTYDGEALTKQSATLTSGTLVSGHSATFGIAGSQTNVGSSTNTLNSVTIMNGTTDVSDNYNITKQNGTLTVNRATTATQGACINPTYNGSAQNIAGGGSNVTYSSNNSQINHSSSNISVSVTPTSNYAWSDGTYAAKTLNCNIAQKELTITAANKSKTYGTANPTLTYTNIGAVGSETPAFTGALATSATTSSNVGSYDITQGTLALTDGTNGFKAINYTISYTKGTLTINRATTATQGACINPTYNGSAQNIAGGGSNVTYSNNNSQINHSSSNINVSVTPTSNYAWSDGTYAAKTLSCNIVQKELTITVNDESMTYGTSAPSYSYSVTGIISGETPISGTATYTIKSGNTIISDVSTASVGTYSISVSGLTINNNYTPSYVDGTLTISNAALTGGSVTITGENIVGGTLTANVTDTTPVADNYAYQWYRGSTAISGATSSTYTVTSSDVNSILKVVVTATKADYSPKSFNDTTDATANSTEKSAYKYTATTKKNVTSATGTDTSVSCYAYSSTASCNITVPTNPYTLTNWTFNGWVKPSSATATTTTTTSGATTGTISINSNTNIIATWKNTSAGTQYTATTKKNVTDATGTDTTASCNIATVYNGATIPTTCSVTLPTNPYTLTNWTFNGWVKPSSATATTTTTTSGSTTTMEIGSNTNIIATWKKTVGVTLTFDKNGGSANTTSASVNTTLYNGATSIPSGTSLTFIAPACTTKANYDCLGYATTSSATTSSWNVGTTKSISVAGLSVPIDNTTVSTASGYYHVWTGKVYAITLNKENGTGGTSTIYAKYGDGYYLTNTSGTVTDKMSSDANPITVPTRSGYTFAGYYTAENGGTPYIDSTGHLVTDNASVTNFTAASNLYAHWTKDVSDLTIALATTTYTYDGSAKTPAISSIKDGSTSLATSQYSVSYSNNINANKGESVPVVIISGENIFNSTTKAYYTGTTSIPFTINKATPTVTLSEVENTMTDGQVQNITATVKSGTSATTVSGTLTAESSLPGAIDIAPQSTTITNANNSTGVVATTSATAVAGGQATINYVFTPGIDYIDNYNIVTVPVTITATNKVIVEIYKDGYRCDNSTVSNTWPCTGTKAIKLEGTTTKVLTISGYYGYADNVAADTYDVFATKSSTNANYYDTGVDVTITTTSGVTSNVRARINYYTATINKDSNVGSVSGSGIYLANQNVSISASSISAGYHFASWNAPEGTLSSPTSASTSISSISDTITATATSGINTYNIAFDGNTGIGSLDTISNQEFNTTVSLPINEYEKSGYTFTGWNTKADGTGTAYLNGTSIILDSTTVSGLANDATITLYAQWIETQAIFDIGSTVNQKMKRLSGSTSATHTSANSNITNIERADELPATFTIDTYGNITPPSTDNIVSASNSNVPIYMWFDNGKIYWWSEDPNPDFNANSSYFFNDLNGLTSFDSEHISSNNVTNMSYMFNGCTNLNELEISTLNTSNVQDMSYMFAGLHQLEELDLTTFNTTSVQNMSYMFSGSTSLVTLDLSSFSTATVTNMGYMFNGCTSLFTIYASDAFVTTNVSTATNMFNNIPEILGGAGTTYVTSAVSNKNYAKIDGGPNSPGYFRGKLQVRAVDLAYDNSVTNIPCEDAQCALDYINNVLNVKYTVVFDGNGGTGDTRPQLMFYGQPAALYPNPFINGDKQFSGWNTASDGTGDEYEDQEVVKDLTITNGATVTLYAQWLNNPIIFGNKSITTTYSASAQTQAITAATNGTTPYTYAKVSEKNAAGETTNYFTVSGTNITIAAGTKIGTYTLVIRVTDAESYTKKATYTIQINKATPTVTLTSKTAQYTGSPIEANEPTINPASVGTVSYIYYTDSSCSTETTTASGATGNGRAPANAGQYYVKAKISSTGNYNSASSACTSHVITKKTDTISVTTKTYTYSGGIKTATITTASGSTPAVTYYSDSSCSTQTTTSNANTTGGRPKTVGTYYVIATTTTSTNYWGANSGCKQAIVISKATPTVTLEAKTATYTGNNIAANTASVSPTGGTLTYTYYTDNACTTGQTATAPVNAGQYYVKARTSATDNTWAAVSACTSHKINKATPTITLTAKTASYTGSPIAANTASVSPSTGGAISYKYYTNNTCTSGETSTAPTNVGQYYVKATVAATSNYSSNSTTCISHKINATTVTVTYYLNRNNTDTSTVSQTFTSGVSNQKFGYENGSLKWGNSGQFGSWDREGYTLLGWSENRSATAASYATYSPVGDSWIVSASPSINLYAVWKQNTYTITLNANGGSIPSTTGWSGSGNSATASVKYGNYFPIPPEPTRSGYNFLGWYETGGWFDADYYASAYPDVVSAVGDSEGALRYHWISSGIYEGRLTSELNWNSGSNRKKIFDVTHNLQLSAAWEEISSGSGSGGGESGGGGGGTSAHTCQGSYNYGNMTNRQCYGNYPGARWVSSGGNTGLGSCIKYYTYTCYY